MFNNYLIVAIRNIMHKPFQAGINILGLSTAMTIGLLALVYGYHELTYERMHKNKDRIYRVACSLEREGNVSDWAPGPIPLGPALQSEFPEVVSYARLMVPFESNNYKVVVEVPEKKLNVEKVYRIDSSFFELFSFEFLYGGSETLDQPDEVIISEELSHLLFPGQDPTGEMITINKGQVFIGGVVKKGTHKTHLDFNMLISWDTFGYEGAWTEADAYTYVLLTENHKPDLFESKLEEFSEVFLAEIADQLEGRVAIFPQPLEEIHLRSNLHAEFSRNGRSVYVYTSFLIALFVILVACINYINLTMARSVKRAKEVAVRKTIGALNGQIRRQFLVESLLTTSISFVLAWILSLISIPFLEQFSGIKWSTQMLLQYDFLLNALLLFLGIATVHGLYPAVHISLANRTHLLNPDYRVKKYNLWFRRMLVILQFSFSIIVIILSIIITAQLDYAEKNNPAFINENIVVLSIPKYVSHKLGILKEELKAVPEVVSASGSTYLPSVPYKEDYVFKINGRQQRRIAHSLYFDHEFLDLTGIPLVEGRNFQKINPADHRRSYLVNETAVRTYGWSNPIGQPVNRYGEVVGVISDTHLFSLHAETLPLIVGLSDKEYLYDESLFVQISPGDPEKALVKIESLYHRTMGEAPFEYMFLNNEFQELYRDDINLKKSLAVGGLIMLLISGMGTFALSAIVSAQKTKETGVRKVFGAKPNQLWFLHMKELFSFLLVAILLSVPIANYLAGVWLQEFAYRIEVNYTAFVAGSAIGTLLVTLPPAFYILQSIKMNPIVSLRYE